MIVHGKGLCVGVSDDGCVFWFGMVWVLDLFIMLGFGCDDGMWR